MLNWVPGDFINHSHLAGCSKAGISTVCGCHLLPISRAGSLHSSALPERFSELEFILNKCNQHRIFTGKFSADQCKRIKLIQNSPSQKENDQYTFHLRKSLAPGHSTSLLSQKPKPELQLSQHSCQTSKERLSMKLQKCSQNKTIKLK